MRNQYPGICYYCNKHVEVGEGFFELRFKDGKVIRKLDGKTKWFLIHAECVIQQRNDKISNLGGTE